jgi:hypothetical protein
MQSVVRRILEIPKKPSALLAVNTQVLLFGQSGILNSEELRSDMRNRF